MTWLSVCVHSGFVRFRYLTTYSKWARSPIQWTIRDRRTQTEQVATNVSSSLSYMYTLKHMHKYRTSSSLNCPRAHKVWQDYAGSMHHTSNNVLSKIHPNIYINTSSKLYTIEYKSSRWNLIDSIYLDNYKVIHYWLKWEVFHII